VLNNKYVNAQYTTALLKSVLCVLRTKNNKTGILVISEPNNLAKVVEVSSRVTPMGLIIKFGLKRNPMPKITSAIRYTRKSVFIILPPF
jgi:hypothetical protein